MAQKNQDTSPIQRLQNAWQRWQQTNWRAQAHYAVFRTMHHLKQKNHGWQHYQQRLRTDWPKWLGMGAGFTGLLLLLNPAGIWRWQLLFVLLSTVMAPWVTDIWASLRKPFTEYPGKQFIGQVLTLEQPIVDGKGSTKLENQLWHLTGADTPAGTQVRVIAIHNRTLYITALNRSAVAT